MEAIKQIPQQLDEAMKFREHLQNGTHQAYMEPPLVVYRGAEHKAEEDMRNMINHLRRSEARKAVPQFDGYNAMTREIMLLLFANPYHHDRPTTEIISDKQNIARRALYNLCVLIRRFRFTPNCWQIAKGVSLDKQNGKKKTLRRRIINILHPAGKAHRKAILEDKGKKTCPFCMWFHHA